MSTKSFIINLPIITGDQDRRRLRKSFSFGCNLQNAVMGGGWDRVLQMRATPEWQATRAMPKGRERTKAFRDLRVRFRLSEYDFHADVAKHRKASGRGHLLGINECQYMVSSLIARAKEALQKTLLPSRMEQKCSVQFFLTTPGGAVFLPT